MGFTYNDETNSAEDRERAIVLKCVSVSREQRYIFCLYTENKEIAVTATTDYKKNEASGTDNWILDTVGGVYGKWGSHRFTKKHEAREAATIATDALAVFPCIPRRRQVISVTPSERLLAAIDSHPD